MQRPKRAKKAKTDEGVPPTGNAEKSPEEIAKEKQAKELSEASQAFAKVLKEAKAQYDKMNRELGEVTIIENRISTKMGDSWGDGPL
eukprot:5777797-Pyramimonas_sp.AAC.1